MSKIKVLSLMALEGLVLVVGCASLDIEVGLIPAIILFVAWEFTWGLRKKKP